MQVLESNERGGASGGGLSPDPLSRRRREADDARAQAAVAEAEARRAAQAAHDALTRCIAAHDQDVVAFVARKLLRPGCPCPVCGSVQHPAPAQVGADTDGADYELEAARRLLARAQAAADAAQQRLARAEAKLEALLARRSSPPADTRH